MVILRTRTPADCREMVCRLLIGRNAFLEQSIHPTLGGATATSETPNARRDRFMDFLSTTRTDRLRNVGVQDPTPDP